MADPTPEVTLSLEPIRADAREILGVYENVLLYGPGGTGKTFIAGTSPGPIWFLTPGGTNELKTVFSPAFHKKHGKDGEIFVTSVQEDRNKGQMSDNPSGYDRCCDAVDSFLEWNLREGIGVQTIVIDNATVMEEYMMNKAIMAEYQLAGDKEKSVLKREREYGIRKPHDSTYGGAQSFMTRWVAWLKELPFHLVFIAHDYEVSRSIVGSRERELVSIRPLFIGQQRTSIPREFDNVWYTKVSGGGRSTTWGAQSERSELVLAKTRVGGILNPDYERDINLTKVIKKFSDYAKSIEEK